MKTTETHELLRAYAQDHSESAFQELVHRYVDLVYSAAIRRVDGNTQLAEDVTQEVFTHLARKAGSLPPNVTLGGWLHRHTGFVASTAMRGEQRRRNRERQAVEMNALNEPSEADWKQLAPGLDEAMDELDAADRDALVLRYFERRELRAVGAALGVGDDTAQKRVSRALDKLREHLSRRGISSTATALSIVLCANAVQAAPAGLAVTISTAALAGTILTTTATATAVKTIAMTTLQKTIIAAALATAVGTGVYEARQASRLQDQVQSLQQQQAEQSQLLQRERDEANRLASALSKVQTESGNPKELLQLRTEVTRLRKQAEALAADAKEAKDSQSDMMQIISNTPPIRTFVSTAMITTAWNQAIVTGGWKTPSGRHAIVVATASPVGSNGNTVRPGDNLQQLNIKSYVLEYTEDAGTATGLAEFNTDGQSATKATELSADQFEAIRKAADNHDGIEIITLQSVTTASGRHTEVETVDTHQTPSGEKYSTGPVIDLIPSIASDGQSVQMMISAHLNYLVQAPKH